MIRDGYGVPRVDHREQKTFQKWKVRVSKKVRVEGSLRKGLKVSEKW